MWGGLKENFVLLYEQKEVDTTLSVHQSINKNLIFLLMHYLLIHVFIFTCGTLTIFSYVSFLRRATSRAWTPLSTR